MVSNKEPSFSPTLLAIRSARIPRIADSSAGGEMPVIATKPLVEKDSSSPCERYPAVSLEEFCFAEVSTIIDIATIHAW